jgi:3'-phosphoadenosine 5'-phosphosulfate (PAPS) 3'-phosphatase
LDIEHACLWIDPIDCTRGFINGNIEDVTVLIGLSYNNKPQLGIIGTPYKIIGGVKTFDPVITVGSVK